ncbi:hypothetical protein TNCV_1425291 [Trichonephila clavipes]|nr:hypothetical protein TNCV_1425291 [Trichonephila clavipes]
MQSVSRYQIRREKARSHPRATTAKEDNHLSIIARHKRDATTTQLSRELYAAIGTRVSRVTVSKRLYARAVCKKTCCLYPSQLCEQDNPLKIMQRS